MEHNPYRPPATPVSDPVVTPPLERPPAVTRAIRLLWIATFIGIATGVYGIATSPTEGAMKLGEIIGYAVATAIIVGISYWIFNAIWRGRNWARILLLVLAIINVLSSLAAAPLLKRMGLPMPEMSVVEIVSYVVQVGLTVYAIILLFAPSSRPWFAPRD